MPCRPRSWRGGLSRLWPGSPIAWPTAWSTGSGAALRAAIRRWPSVAPDADGGVSHRPCSRCAKGCCWRRRPGHRRQGGGQGGRERLGLAAVDIAGSDHLDDPRLGRRVCGLREGHRHALLGGEQPLRGDIRRGDPGRTASAASSFPEPVAVAPTSPLFPASRARCPSCSPLVWSQPPTTGRVPGHPTYPVLLPSGRVQARAQCCLRSWSSARSSASTLARISRSSWPGATSTA